MNTMRALAVALAVSSTPAARADEIADFYKGKVVTIMVGTAPGGGFDTVARVFAQNLNRHIPGNPSVVVQNLPGGGGLKAAVTLYNNSPKDGTALGEFSANIILEPLYGNAQATYDSSKFEWIGSMDVDVQACGVWRGAGVGIKTLDDVIRSPKSLAFGSTAPSGGTSLYPLFVKNALGAPIKVINGYNTTKEVLLAMARGELDGLCGITQATSVEDLQSGDIDLFMHIGMDRKVPVYGNATPISEAIKTPELRKIAELVFNPNLMSRPLAAPPGVPKARVAALRRAFEDNMRDPDTIALGARANMHLTPMSGDEMQTMIAGFMATPPELVKKAYEYTHVE